MSHLPFRADDVFLSAQLLAAFRAAAGQNVTTVTISHAAAESVAALANQSAGLKSSFHFLFVLSSAFVSLIKTEFIGGVFRNVNEIIILCTAIVRFNIHNFRRLP